MVAKRLRQEILDRYDAGALLQPGPLTYRVTEHDRPSFSRPHLVLKFGEDEVREWEEFLPRIEYRAVVVRGRNRPRASGDASFWSA